MTIHRYLVTALDDPRFKMWSATSSYTNWIEGRPNGTRGETWLVTCYDNADSDRFLASARATKVTVEEIEGSGDAEQYLLRVGEPDTGWTGTNSRESA